jgi:hypothetical protein
MMFISNNLQYHISLDLSSIASYISCLIRLVFLSKKQYRLYWYVMCNTVSTSKSRNRLLGSVVTYAGNLAYCRNSTKRKREKTYKRAHDRKKQRYDKCCFANRMLLPKTRSFPGAYPSGVPLLLIGLTRFIGQK